MLSLFLLNSLRLTRQLCQIMEEAEAFDECGKRITYSKSTECRQGSYLLSLQLKCFHKPQLLQCFLERHFGTELYEGRGYRWGHVYFIQYYLLALHAREPNDCVAIYMARTAK